MTSSMTAIESDYADYSHAKCIELRADNAILKADAIDAWETVLRLAEEYDATTTAQYANARLFKLKHDVA